MERSLTPVPAVEGVSLERRFPTQEDEIGRNWCMLTLCYVIFV